MQKTIYAKSYRRLIEELKQTRRKQKLRQEDVARRIGRSRHWIQKMETFQIRLDVLQLIKLCRVYNLQPSQVIRRLEEEEASDEDPLFTYHMVISPGSWIPNWRRDWFLKLLKNGHFSGG